MSKKEFFVPDESAEEVFAIFDAGAKGITAPVVTSLAAAIVGPSANAGNALSTVGTRLIELGGQLISMASHSPAPAG